MAVESKLGMLEVGFLNGIAQGGCDATYHLASTLAVESLCACYRNPLHHWLVGHAVWYAAGFVDVAGAIPDVPITFAVSSLPVGLLLSTRYR